MDTNHGKSPQLPELWDTKRVAEYLGTTEHVIAQERLQGRGLPYVKVGKRVRYRVSDIIAYLDANAVIPQRYSGGVAR